MTLQQKFSLKDATIGVVTALAEEFTAVCAILGCKYEVAAPGADSARVYKLGVISHRANQGAHIVAITRLSDMGNNSAVARASSMLTDCPRVKDIIMCGIAGAVPNPNDAEVHVRLGDIVVSGNEGVLQYDLVSSSEDNIKRRSRPRPPSAHIWEGAQLLESDGTRGERHWEKYIEQGVEALGPDWRRPAPHTDLLREAYWATPKNFFITGLRFVLGRYTKNIDYLPIPHPIDLRRRAGNPRIFHGLIASSNTLLRNPATRNVLREEDKARAVEMEGSGIADTAYHHGIGYFVVRGTTDYCNGHKNDEWHFYAALIAAAYTRALIEAIPPRYVGSAEETLVTAASVTTGIAGRMPRQEQEPLENGTLPQVVIERLVQEVERRVRAEQQLEGFDAEKSLGAVESTTAVVVAGQNLPEDVQQEVAALFWTRNWGCLSG